MVREESLNGIKQSEYWLCILHQMTSVMHKGSYVLLFLFLIISPAFCDEISNLKVTHISLDEGLSQATVNTILSDRFGFLWFGTQDGLNRYDGYSMSIFRTDPGNSNSLSSSYIADIHEDPEGIIWIGTLGGGLNRYDPVTEEFTWYIHRADDPGSISSNQVYSLYPDKNGTLWIGTDGGGLNRLNTKTGDITRYRHNPDDPASLSDDHIREISKGTDGLLWLATPTGLVKMDPDTVQFTQFMHQEQDPTSLHENQTVSVYHDRTGVLWALHPSGLDRYNPETGGFSWAGFETGQEESEISEKNGAVLQDREGVLWVGTRGSGLKKYNPETNQYISYQNDPSDPDTLSSDAVRSLYEDAAGAIWIGTDEAGVNRYDPRVRQFATYRHDPADPDSISTSDIFAVYEDQHKNLWIGGTDGILNQLNRSSGITIRYAPSAEDGGLAPSRLVGPIYGDDSDTLWVGTFGGSGLHSFNTTTGTFHRYSHDPTDPSSLSDNNIIWISRDREKFLWIGTESGGLNRFDVINKTFRAFRNDPDIPGTISSNNVRVVYEDHEGTLWIGTFGGGLNRFDRNTGNFTSFRHDAADVTSISDDTVYSIHEDLMGILWVGTANGLNAFNKTTGRFLQISGKERLPDGVIYSIIEDKRGVFWLSTNAGIVSYNPVSKAVHTYTSKNGIASDEFNDGSYWQSRSGEIFFGGINGLTSFYPEQIRSNTYVPPVVLVGFELANKPVPVNKTSPLHQSITVSQDLVLSYRDNILSIEFSSLNYDSPSLNRYRYRMSGFEQDWNEVDSSRRLATYTNLPPGSYLFQVLGSNNDGVWNETGRSLHLTITPPWWDTSVFRAGLIIALIVLLYGAYQIRIRSLKNRAAELETEVRERTEELHLAKEKAEQASQAKTAFLSRMSHELRTPLNAILGYAQILVKQENLSSEQKSQISTIRKSGEHLLTLINDVLDMSRIESRRMELSQAPFSLLILLDHILSIIKIKADEKGLSLIYKPDAALPQSLLGDERKVKQILINLLTNAVRYTSEGQVILTVRYQDEIREELIIEVSDTGVGIPSDKQQEIFEPFVRLVGDTKGVDGVGLGLSITRELVGLMQGTIQVASEPGVGSMFTVSLPLPRALQTPESIIPENFEQIIGYQGEELQILIVDDNTTNIEVLHALFNPLGFRVRSAENGREALKVAGEIHPELILMDLVMPEMDGLDAVRAIRADPDLSGSRIIGLSASITRSDRKELFISSCDDYATKPIQIDILLEKIRALIGIEWIYTREAAPQDKMAHRSDCIPPREILEAITRAADQGDYRALEELVHLVRIRYPGSDRFCDTVSRYASRYDEEAIVDYLNSHIKSGDVDDR